MKKKFKGMMKFGKIVGIELQSKGKTYKEVQSNRIVIIKQNLMKPLKMFREYC